MIAREIHGKSFRARENRDGRAGAATIFQYFVGADDSLHGAYAGGEIATGQLVGSIRAQDRIEVLFQCITTRGELLSGRSEGIVSRGADSRLCLDFTWIWLSGDEGGGTSSYVEFAPVGGDGS